MARRIWTSWGTLAGMLATAFLWNVSLARADELDEIRGAVRERTTAIRSMEVAYTVAWKRLQDPPGRTIDAPREGQYRADWKMSRGRWREFYSRSPDQTYLFDGQRTLRLQDATKSAPGAGVLWPREVRSAHWCPDHAFGLTVRHSASPLHELLELKTVKLLGETMVLETPCQEVEIRGTASVDAQGKSATGKMNYRFAFEKAAPHRLRRVHHALDTSEMTDPAARERAEKLVVVLLVTEFTDVPDSAGSAVHSFPVKFQLQTPYTTEDFTVSSVKLNTELLDQLFQIEIPPGIKVTDLSKEAVPGLN